MDEVRPFFERYAEAFAGYDAEAIAGCFAVPCLFVRDGVTVAVTDAPGVAASVAALLDLHRAWDVQTVAAGEIALLEAGPGHAVARVDWRLGRPKSRLTWAYATTYTLVPAEGGWRIAVAITHDAPF